MEELIKTFSSTSQLLTILLAVIAGISLVVGGIGIMNIMYVSVTERTREIGLRMAIGARGVDILLQFLTEAIMISITGAVIGVILGITASKLVTVFLSWPTLITESSIILSFMVCVITGVFFGYYPAQKASRLDPIEALRYE
jgi:putative ABC transport system permease protein